MKNLKNKKGAAAVEFALVLPILIVLVFGIIEFSIVLYDKAVITNASREGARAGIVFKTDSNQNYAPLTVDEIRAIVNTYCGNYLITFGSSTTVTTTVARDNPAPGYLRVAVSYPYSFLILPDFVTDLTGSLNLNAVTVMRMEL